jgi:transcriptional regulator with XRE-family HTH domain
MKAFLEPLVATQVMMKLVRLRRRKMTASEAARKMGVTRQQVYNIESGYQGDPSILTVERYAKAIGAKLAVLDRRPRSAAK